MQDTTFSKFLRRRYLLIQEGKIIDKHIEFFDHPDHSYFAGTLASSLSPFSIISQSVSIL